MIEVLVEATGVVTVVSEDYYEKYKSEGITKVEKPKPKRKAASPKKKTATIVKKEE